MTVKEIIIQYRAELSHLFDSSELEHIISLVFNDVMHYSKTDLILKKDEMVSDTARQTLLKYLNELKQNKPIQYIQGYTWFYGLKLNVNENVLIPRPETEELVNKIIADYESERTSNPKILDIGTGSGCIAIALKANLPDCQVYCMDISEKALEVAKRNATSNDVEVIFIQGDILKSQTSNSKPETSFDIIVSNPPYIRKSEMKSMDERVTSHEPHLALFVEDDDPLLYYQAIIDFAKTFLKKDGRLYFEINEALGKEVVLLLKKNKFVEVSLIKDISGKDRIVKAEK